MASTADVRVGNAAIHSKLHVPEFSTRPLRKVFVIMSREAKPWPVPFEGEGTRKAIAETGVSVFDSWALELLARRRREVPLGRRLGKMPGQFF